MKSKRIAALIVSVCLIVGALTACSHNEQSSSKVQRTDVTTENIQSAPKYDYKVTWEDMAEINVALPVLSSIPAGLADVEAAINEITENQLNTHVNLEMIEQGNYAQQLSLKITSGETVDLMLTIIGGSTSFTTMSSQNQLMDITELVETYAPKALAEIGEVINATRVDGKILAFPAYRNYSSGPYIVMRTDVLEDLGLLEKAQNMTSFTEYEEILETVRNSEKWGELTGVVPSSVGNVLPALTSYAYADRFSDTKYIDNLGNTQNCIGVRDGDETATVMNVFASDEYRSNYELVKKWYDAGFVYKDAANTADLGSELIKAGTAFSMINVMGVGADIAADSQCGREMTCVFIAAKPVNTTDCVTFTYAVPITAREPEAAVAFLEMMFNDKTVLNLLTWGIEGSDYELNEAGVASHIDQGGMALTYVPSWMSVSEFDVIPSVPWDVDSWEKQRDYNSQAKISEYLGFSVNMDAFSNEVSALNTVINEYSKQIGAGAASKDDFASFLEKLKASGIDKIVQAYQDALQEWIASR